MDSQINDVCNEKAQVNVLEFNKFSDWHLDIPFKLTTYNFLINVTCT